jgi:ACT domain-containing protein
MNKYLFLALWSLFWIAFMTYLGFEPKFYYISPEIPVNLTIATNTPNLQYLEAMKEEVDSFRDRVHRCEEFAILLRSMMAERFETFEKDVEDLRDGLKEGYHNVSRLVQDILTVHSTIPGAATDEPMCAMPR